MLDLNNQFYQEVTKEIIEAGLNKFDARNKLADILDNYQVTYVENDPNKYDVRRNISNYLKQKEHEGLSPLTLVGYKRQLDIFAERIGDKKIQDITKDNLIEFLESRKSDEKMKSMRSIETVRSILRSFYVWLYDEGLIKENPMLRVRPYKQEKPMAKALSVEELEKVREACIDLREKALVELLYSTGCRLEEFVNLNISDIDYTNRTIKVIGKGNKERLVFFSVRGAIHLENYLDSREDDCEALFVTVRKPYRRMERRAVQREVAKIGERAKLNKNLSPHIFRHTMASLLLNKGCPMHVVQELLGHDDVATTQTYARTSFETKHHSYEKYFHQ